MKKKPNPGPSPAAKAILCCIAFAVGWYLNEWLRIF